MKTYNFKRAALMVENTNSDTYYAMFHQIKRYQKEISSLLSKNVDRQHNSVILRQQKIAQLRATLKNRPLPTEVWVFNVFVKQYQKHIDIEYVLTVGAPSSDQRIRMKEMFKAVIDDAIKGIRSWNKAEPFPHKFGHFVIQSLGNKKVGWVASKEGEVLRCYIEKNIKSLYTDKVPTEPKKYIGIELEFCAPIKEQQLALKLFKGGIHKFAQLKKDGSLRPHEDKKEHGYELAILLEESNYKKRLKQITNILTEVGAITKDRRAGLHVHLDMRRRNKDIVYNNLVACQYVLLSIVDPIRYNNEFCQVVHSRKFPTEFTGERAERYKTINAAAFYKYKTLEVRMHEGSVDYEQISNWVDLLVKIANYSKKLKSNVPKISALNKRFNLNKKQARYWIDKSCFWQVQNSDHTRNLRRQFVVTGTGLLRYQNEPQPDRPDSPLWEQSASPTRVGLPPLESLRAEINNLTTPTQPANVSYRLTLPLVSDDTN